MSQALLSPSPSDGLTSLRFSPSNSDNDLLVVSSWDGHLYTYSNNSFLQSYPHNGALLDCAFANSEVLCAGLSGLALTNLQLGNQTQLYDQPVRCVELSERNLAICGTWAGELLSIDIRSNEVMRCTLNDGHKALSMSLLDDFVALATTERSVYLFDIRKSLTSSWMQRQSALAHQTRCIRLFKYKYGPFKGEVGFALSSVEGRVAVEMLDADASKQEKYAFKCHRTINLNGENQLHPVNAIAFHPAFGTFVTGGCDGFVSIWDPVHKKRICQYTQYPNDISALNFNSDGSKLAIGVSYTYEFGEFSEKLNKPNQIYVRNVVDSEVYGKSVAPR